jgi:hypothetical protein
MAPIGNGHRAQVLRQIKPGFFEKTAFNELRYFRADTAFAVGSSDADQRKAFARLDRGSSYPIVSAMSGYSQGHRQDVLNNAVWTRKAKSLCKKLGCNAKDSFSSHVEKQLVAYYLEKHVLSKKEDMYEDTQDYEILEGSRGVLLHPPPAIITVNKNAMCSECNDFWQQFKVVFMDIPLRIVCVGQM